MSNYEEPVDAATSWRMQRVGTRDTSPEVSVRKLLHRLGYRFRLQRRDLPGSPDIVLPKYRTVLFVHGCYWHRHDCRKGRSVPTKRRDYWLAKFDRNVSRDARARKELEQLGWRVLVVWECELKDEKALASRLTRELNPGD